MFALKCLTIYKGREKNMFAPMALDLQATQEIELIDPKHVFASDDEDEDDGIDDGSDIEDDEDFDEESDDFATDDEDEEE